MKNEIQICKKPAHRTIKSLRLDLEAAEKGRTWLLLPEGFRAQECGMTYPLPSRRIELQKLVAIYIPKNKKDCGCLYLRRALQEWKNRQMKRSSAILDVTRREEQIAKMQHNFALQAKELRAKCRAAVDDVRREAQQAIANLNDLFSLARKGLDGQMRAHLEGQEWQGETINARAFRECFRMVTQTVKGLGLPSEERTRAKSAIMDEVAEALKDTQETVALAPGGDDDETEH